MRVQWQVLLQATVPLLHQLIAADRAAKRNQDQRVRVGMYMFSETMTSPTGALGAKARARSGKAKPKGK